MTKDQFEVARWGAVLLYMHNALLDTVDKTKDPDQIANAERRYDFCLKITDKWLNDGFWTDSNKVTYAVIYKNQEDTTSVTPF